MDKEKLVRDLVNTFNDRDELHMAYKERMKHMFLDFFYYISAECAVTPDDEIDVNLITKFIDLYVEERFRPEK